MTIMQLDDYVNQTILDFYERGVIMAKKNNASEATINETNMERETNTMLNNETINTEVANSVAVEEKTDNLANHVNDEMRKLVDTMPITADGIQESVTRDGKIVTKREYTLINPIGKRTTLTTFDASIIESTEKIGLALHGRKVLDFAICRELCKINTPKKLESMGFRNIGEYASSLFDLSRVTATQYARIGRVFIGDDYKIKSTILPSSLTKGHLIELLSMVGEDDNISSIESAFIDGELSDSMSTSKMRKAIKQLKTAVTVDENGLIEDKNHENGAGAEPLENGVENSSESKDVAKGEDVNTTPPETTETLVATILSNVDEIRAAFEKINVGGVSVIGYEDSLSTIAALAKSVIGIQ